MPHLLLLGDSIFDNQAYVGSGPPVIEQVRGILPAGWQATLGAVDGHVTTDVPGQLARVPADTTHLIVSAGGNDALGAAHVLGYPVASVAEAMLSLSQVVETFEHNYRRMVQVLLQHGLPTALCTIYNPRFSEPIYQRAAVAALCLFNDCIIRTATAAGLPLLDLRLIFTDFADYANDIEPSVSGGTKLAERISQLVQGHDFALRRTFIYS